MYLDVLMTVNATGLSGIKIKTNNPNLMPEVMKSRIRLTGNENNELITMYSSPILATSTSTSNLSGYEIKTV